MAAPKDRNVWGLMLALESVYGTAVALAAATDGVLALEAPDVELAYAHDGSRNGTSPGIGPLKRVGKSGRNGTVKAVTEAIGGAAAYSASVKPSIHNLLRVCGFGATLDAGLGVEKYTYAQVASAYASGTLESYVNGQKYPLAGVYGDISMGVEAGAVPRWEANLMGIATAVPTDAAVPAITYPSASPPKAETMVLTVGSYLPVIVKEASYTLNRAIAPRAYDNTGNRHGGFAIGRPAPTLELVIEMVNLAASPFHTVTALNPYELAERGTSVVTSFEVGSVQYNRFKLSAAQAQITDAEELEEGPTAMWRLKFQLNPSTYTALDTHSWIFN